NITPVGATTLCSGDSVELQSDTANTYLWLFNGSGTGQISQSIYVSTAGDYQVVVSNISGCTDTSAIETITVNLLPIINTSSILIDSSNCGNSDGSITGITVSSGTPSYTYEWVDGTFTIVGGDSANLVNVPSDAYTLTVTDSNSCSAVSGPHTINDAGAPPTPTASSPSPYCSGDPISDLTADSTGGILYWFSDAALTDTLGTGSPFTSGATVTDTFYVAEIGACLGLAAQVIVTINPSPTATITALDTTTFCFGDSVELQSGVANTYEWFLNGISIGEYTQNIFTSTAGGYQVVVTNTDSCSDTSAVETVTVNSLLPIPNFGYSDSSLTVTFTDLSVNETMWTWDFGDGNTDTVQNPVHTYDNAGTYNVCLTVGNACGSDSICDSVTVICIPSTANFGYSDANLTVNFSDSSSNGITWYWDFGDGNTDTLQNPVHTYTTAGTYNVCLTAGNACGSDTACDSVTTKVIRIQLFIPSAFSPNGDGENDVFRVIGSGIKNISLVIYNRWGETVFETEDKEEATEIGWDGRHNGEEQGMAVFVYYVEVEFEDTTNKTYKGDVTLIR
ncbi:MAG: gliding motility-associated C-terminal domain-containing protein, partial [Bacteroidetes bacterium]|nr:gliding motility-associated C-terminal domain-containing protein [Bacteroidota bacterium]